jgi:uncharacterized protein DUF4038/uncharacterized protein DUF5060
MYARMAELSVESRTIYADPFNDVEVDVVFERNSRSWRVPAFWAGAHKWTVRFAPPSPGEYTFRWECTDARNEALHGRAGRVELAPYGGQNVLLQRGALRVSASGRYFEHLDGTPFYWLGDTWWTGLSERLSVEDFKTLTADRKLKGFTLVQIVAGLVPPEELAPSDSGFCNEGGAVWEPKFARINPKYFDAADLRIEHLLDNELLPAIVGGWRPIIHAMGVTKLKQHWRYVIARYGAYPVIWVLGGELIDPPPDRLMGMHPAWEAMMSPGWTEVARYVRDIDPYHHPLSAHESPPPFDSPLQDESLTDFDLLQSGHFGWSSIATAVAQVNSHYARRGAPKPVVQGEIGYEKLGELHLEDFQRVAFWLSMLNGAAGHTYGANGTWEAYSGGKPLHRIRHSFLSWKEGMELPGSYQVGLNATLLSAYPWWRFEPHPEWVTPHGTTLLDAPEDDEGGARIAGELLACDPADFKDALEENYPGGEWRARGGNFRKPYAAGIPQQVRFIYIPPQTTYLPAAPPTVLGLEPGIRYQAFFWEPSFGIRVELGWVERPASGAILFSAAVPKNSLAEASTSRDTGSGWIAIDDVMSVRDVSETDVIAAFATKSDAGTTLLARYRDPQHCIAAIYSPQEKMLGVVERNGAGSGRRLGATAIPAGGGRVTLSLELRGNKAAASLGDGTRLYTTPIVDIESVSAGRVGVCLGDAACAGHLEVRQSPKLFAAASLPRNLTDARGTLRGAMVGQAMDLEGSAIAGWDDFGRDRHILLDAYRPEKCPSSGDWLLVLDAIGSR